MDTEDPSFRFFFVSNYHHSFVIPTLKMSIDFFLLCFEPKLIEPPKKIVADEFVIIVVNRNLKLFFFYSNRIDYYLIDEYKYFTFKVDTVFTGRK